MSGLLWSFCHHVIYWHRFHTEPENIFWGNVSAQCLQERKSKRNDIIFILSDGFLLDSMTCQAFTSSHVIAESVLQSVFLRNKLYVEVWKLWFVFHCWSMTAWGNCCHYFLAIKESCYVIGKFQSVLLSCKQSDKLFHVCFNWKCNRERLLCAKSSTLWSRWRPTPVDQKTRKQFYWWHKSC